MIKETGEASKQGSWKPQKFKKKLHCVKHDLFFFTSIQDGRMNYHPIVLL